MLTEEKQLLKRLSRKKRASCQQQLQ